MAKRAAILVRVSSINQARDEKFGVPVQLEHNEAYARRHGLVVGERYIDALSGAHERRDNFYRLLGDAAQYQAVVIYDTSRIGRDEELSHRFLRLLREAGLEVHSATRGGVVEAGFITSAEIMMAAEVRRTILRTTLNARIAKAEKGGLPSGIKLYGYLSVKGVAMPHPEHASHLKRMFALAAELSFMQISDRYNAEGVPSRVPSRREHYMGDDGQQHTRLVAPRWHHSTVGQIIRNPAYHTGVLPWGRYRLKIPPLVSTETWDRAQHHRTGPPASLDWPLRGHLRCGYCGARMSGSRHGNRYRCQRQRPSCAFSTHRRITEARVGEAVAALLADRGALHAFLTARNPQPDAAPLLAALEHESTEAFAAWRRGIITADELALVRRDLEGQRRTLLAAQEPPPADDALLDELADDDPWEVLKTLAIVVTITKTDTVLGLG